MKTTLLVLVASVTLINYAQAQLVPGAPGGGHSGHDSRPPQYDPCDSPINNCGGSSSNEDRERDRYERDQERNREIERRERDSRDSDHYNSDRHHDDYYYERDRYREDSYHTNYATAFERHLGRSVMNESISLMRIFDLSNYKGNLSKVTANTTPNSSARTEVLLIADGVVVARQVNPGYQIVLYPNQKVRFGNRLFKKGIKDLKLVIKGSTYINNIQMYF